MTSTNKPPGIPTTLFPFLSVKNGASAVEFYTTAFGAAVAARFDGQDGKLMAQLFIEGAEFWVGDEEPEFGNYSPESIGGNPVRLILTVSDPDAVFARAVEAGATQICPVTTEESWKIGKLKDPFGHIWEIGHPLHEA
ncbi:VOC family protein [Chitinophaga japonensis]|uniref:PhnB protein n=1 Tax=Chitinophaga japonensis TaxID=104662 RepID=A0A562T318_CHIJA|nr:VOC family protein [Chitinophaga japonensis]TWI87942.1 PhnB protein [Chitinophaga japonensis]